MTSRSEPLRAHLVAGGFPRGSSAGHDIDYARLRLLEGLRRAGSVATSVSSDFQDLAEWLPRSRLLVSYVAGPYLDDARAAEVQTWLEAGGRWLALHGSSGGKAIPNPDGRPGRTMVRLAHHEVLGAHFMNHPPIRAFEVGVRDPKHILTRGLPRSFEVMDELYLFELTAAEETSVLLTTTDLGVDDPAPREFGFSYGEDTSVGADGRTRPVAYVRDVGEQGGAVVYVALGHCHTPSTNIQPFVDASVDEEGRTPLEFKGPWETEPFERLLCNAIEWGLGANTE